jgi:folate-binding protein YgfZ
MDWPGRPTQEPEDEHLAVRRAAGFLDHGRRGRFAVSGTDRAEFLQGLLSNDVRSLPLWQGAEALLLTPRGKVIAGMVSYHRPGEYLLDCPEEVREELLARLTMYVLSSDVTIEDRTEKTACLSIHGPRAADVLRLVSGVPVPAGLFALCPTVFPETEALVARVDWYGDTGFDVHLPVIAAVSLSAAFAAAGARRVGPEAGETLRIEAGRARFGAEIDGNTLPPEVPALVERAVSFTKGCFVGQETVARIRTYGHVNRELRGLLVEGGSPPAPGAPVRAAGEAAGSVTSACVPPTLGFPIALAMLKRKYLEPGTVVETDAGGATVPARVVLPGKWI